MTIELTPEQEQRLVTLALEAQRTPEDVAREAISGWLRHLSELASDVREGEASAERDGWLTTDEVFARLHGRLPKTA